VRPVRGEQHLRISIDCSIVAWVSFRLLVSSGWLVKYISRTYSLGRRRSSGASEERIIYSESSRCIMKGTQARPLSTQITFNFGKRSGIPLSPPAVAGAECG
jgi:hypothetical protein